MATPEMSSAKCVRPLRLLTEKKAIQHTAFSEGWQFDAATPSAQARNVFRKEIINTRKKACVGSTCLSR